jgi:hypothetical protein
MRFFCSRTAGFFQTVLVLALVNGCQAAPDAAQLAAARVPSASAPSSQQLIIKFKRAAASCDQAGIARFSAAAGVPLELVRPMSGEACVVTQFGSNASGLARGLDALRKNSAVEWVEPDAVMKAQ